MKRLTILAVVVIIFLTSGMAAPHDFNSNPTILESGTPEDNPRFNLLDSKHSLSHDELEGTLDPVTIEQTGNKTTSTIHAETDSNTNVETNLIIDTANDWVGSKASVNLWNLNRLYVENGSVSEGIEGETKNPDGSVLFYPYGWDAFSGSSDSNMDMLAGYSNQEIHVKANGYGTAANYFYANGSYVYWSQTVSNTPYLENFIFNFDYFYNRGPDANSNVTLRAYVDDTLIWSNTTVTILDSMWYNSGNILVDLTGIGSEFEFKIGLYFSGDVIHTQQFIEFVLDNINLVAETSLTFDDSNIELNIGGESVSVNGTSTGYASIINSSLWRTENVLIEFTTDLSLSFDYTATMLSSRYVNSTRTPTQLDDGVHYTSLPNENPQITFYTFIGTIPDIDNFTMIIRVPEDWANVTVLNPSGTSVTSSCTIHPGNITIPTNLILDNLGWWEVRIESPNYLRTIQTFKLNEPTSTWIPDTVYKTTNKTKLIIVIGGSLPIQTAPQEVGISWLMPNGTEWFSESISGGSLGAINSSQLEFGPLNATTGIWQAEVVWINGTEVAFGYVIFQVHHRTSLTCHESVIDAESGLSISNFVYFQDIENGEFLMDPATTTVTANWSMTVVNFLPDPIQNRWVGTFDTSLVGPGIHLVVVNASRPFFDDVSCTFLVTISLTDNDLIIDNPTAEIGLGDTYLATFSYSDSYGVGIPGADVSIEFSGTIDGITWGELSDLGGGNYSIEFTAVHSDNYVITISASKTYYEESEDALFILVGERTTSLSLENGTAAVISYGEQYRLVVRYTNGSSFGLDSASVSIQSTTPETGISYASTFTNEGNGYYSIILTPTATETYILLINASLTNHRTQFVSFTLAITTIGSQLSIELTQDIIYVNQTSIVTLNFTSDIYGGLDGAIISPYNPPSDLTFSAVTPLGSGLYSIEVSSNTLGSYQIVFTAYAANHNNATTTIILTVVRIPTQLRIAGGTNIASIEFTQSFDLLVFYERTDDSPLNITLALLQLTFTSYETLDYDIIHLAEGYLIRFPNAEIGHYEFIVTASKAGYQNDAVQFTLFVQERAMRVVMSTPIWSQFDPLNITLQLVEDDTGDPVTGADVSYKIYRLLDVEMEGYLTETSPGVYSISIEPGWYSGSAGYEIRIFAEKTNFALDEDYYEFQVVQTIVPEDAIMEFLLTVLPPIGGLVILIVGFVVVRRSLVRTNKRKRAAAREIKNRFNDARNTLGIIILHKDSGLPIYSKILKGGFEEAMMSAFITAIMHFRSEFDTVEENDEYRILPISDIIRAIPTPNLICAFITISSPSIDHEGKMIGYARAIGMLLDDTLSERPTKAVDAKIAKTLEWFFDDHVDGGLLRKYQIGEKGLSGQFKCLEEALPGITINGTFKLDRMIRGLEDCGLSEDDAYLRIMEAIEKELILPIYSFNDVPDSETEVS